MAQFAISKVMLEDFFSKGLKVGEMADKITAMSGIKCSIGKVKQACEHYGLDLKKKSRKSNFVFDDSCGGQGCIVTELPNDKTEVNLEATTDETEVVTDVNVFESVAL